MTPGAYLHKRRVAARMSVAEVGHWFGGSHSQRQARSQLIGLIETEQMAVTPALAAQLRGAFPFDLEILLVLIDNAAGAGLPVPPVCRTCACSYLVACTTVSDRPCEWADAAATICSRCASASRPAACRHPVQSHVEGASA